MNFKYTLFVSLFPLLCLSQVVENYKQLGNEVNINLTEGTLNISSMADNAVRIKFYQEVENSISELIFTSTDKNQRLNVTDLPSKLELKGERIIVFVDKQTGNLSFANYEGKIFLNEKAGTRKLIPDSVMGEPCFIAEQSFESPKDEYLFGLGQFQDGHYNLRNITRCLTQVNSQISLPFIYSSKGHGLLWHQYGLTDFNPADNFINLEKQEQSADGNDQVAEVTTT
ncbi:MAG: DUF4968 domain-containing protein, partial [Ignavibacteriaceae bacterium]